MMKFHNGFIELGFTPNFLPQLQEVKITPYVAPVYDYSKCAQTMTIAADGKVTIINNNKEE